MRKLKKLAPTSNLRLLSFRGTLQRLSVALLTLVMTLTAQTAWADTVDETEVSNWAELKSVSTVNGSTVTLTQCIKTTAELTISETVTLDLNGYGIRSKASSGGVIIIGNGGNLTLKDDAAVKPTRYIPLSGGYGSAVSTSAPGGSYITVSGGYITGSHDSHGVYNSDGTFTMVGGTICGNYKSGIFAYGVTITLAGGTITGNHEHGVYIYGANAVLKMTGGTITGNNVDRDGAGVYVGSSGKFIMAGGSITGNTASGSSYNGGGVYVKNGTCIMTGGTVSGNTAGSGNGNNVYIYNSTDVYILPGCVDGGIGQSSSEYAPKQSIFGTDTDGSDAKPFVISDAAGWNAFCTLINNNIYRDKHFELGDDISVTQMAGGLGNSKNFTGTFDGKNHTLDFNVTTSENNTAPFRYVAGATIRNLHVTGTITTNYRFAAGIVVSVFTPGLTIENCRSSVTINSTYKGEGCHGGILSKVTNGTANITGCVFDGKIITGSTDATKTTTCGGFVGQNTGTVNITDCLYAPAARAEGEKDASTDSYAFVVNWTGGSSTITRCYSTKLFGTKQGTLSRSVTAGDEYVTVAAVNPVGNATATYTTSGITAYAKGIKRNGTFYYGNGDDVSLTLNHGSRTGYFFSSYSANKGTLNGTTLTMPDAKVTISAEWADADDISVNAAGTEYTIKTAKGWDAFCYLLDDNTKGFFDSKTVKLSTDIGTADDPITRMAGASHHDFTGTFDGQGHTLTVDYNTGEQYAAPFRNAENGCVIENLHVAGTIATSAQNAAGVIANQFGTVTIRNCRVSVTISSSKSGDGTHGGFVGIKGNSDDTKLTIEDCVFDGKIVSTGSDATTDCGGFVGWRKDKGSLTITNCLYVPQTDANAVSTGATFARNGGTITNCYYTQMLGDEQGAKADYLLSETATVPSTLSGTVVFRREFKGGKASTICLPFAYTPDANEGTYYSFAGIEKVNGIYVATMAAANTAGSPLTANTPYVFMPNENVSYVPVLYHGTADYDANALTATSGNWTFKGTYSPLAYKANGTANLTGHVYGFASKTKYVDGEGEVQAGEFVHAKDGASVPPMRCYLTYKNGSQFAGTRGMTRADEDLPQTITVRFVDTRGEVTAIGTLNTQTGEIVTDGWYTLNGTRLNGKPSKRGIYINNGRKIVIK